MKPLRMHRFARRLLQLLFLQECEVGLDQFCLAVDEQIINRIQGDLTGQKRKRADVPWVTCSRTRLMEMSSMP